MPFWLGNSKQFIGPKKIRWHTIYDRGVVPINVFWTTTPPPSAAETAKRKIYVKYLDGWWMGRGLYVLLFLFRLISSFCLSGRGGAFQ